MDVSRGGNHWKSEADRGTQPLPEGTIRMRRLAEARGGRGILMHVVDPSPGWGRTHLLLALVV